MAVAVSSASGLLSLLEEDDEGLRLHALQALNKVAHEFWFQIAGSIASVEAFYEDEEFSHRELAALVASKVFYNLGELDEALTYALGAGKLFDVDERSEYVQTILARCIDQYIERRVKAADTGIDAEIDPRMEAIVERMFERCYRDGQYEQAVGIALESRNLEQLKAATQGAPDTVKTLTYALRVSQQLLISRKFREEVLDLLIHMYEAEASPDFASICQCLMFLDDSRRVAHIFHTLLGGSQDDTLLAYQIGFDLFDNEMQSFLLTVLTELEAHSPKAVEEEATAVSTGADGSAAAVADDPMESEDATAGEAAEAAPLLPTGEAAAEPVVAEVELSPADQLYLTRFKKLSEILSGELSNALYLEFLYSANKADLQILRNIKTATEARNSVCHSATIFANAMMHSGTTVDAFLRENLDWLGRATNWAKFSATAGLGVIHRGHLSESRRLMAPYLPRDGASASPFSEGGALYALGLIHANHGEDIRAFLLESLRATSTEAIQHGACLGLGLAGLGTEDEEVYEDLKNVLYMDSAVAGEAAGYGLGLLFVGTASEKTFEMLAYAQDTQHEKIIRGLSMGLALIMYGREEGAERLIEQMSQDQDPIIRYGAMFTIGLAYRGTANNAAIQKLLHFAVSDVSDDVRRAAVINLGFVLLNVPEQAPRIVSLLSESYNPNLRYGAAMAVGVACAATGMTAAVDLLQPLLADRVDFVRQGAMIAMALVLLQQPEARVAPFRKQLAKAMGDKHEEVMCRMGAIMAAGLLDAGGRNMTIGTRSRSGYFRRTSIVGLAIFLQYWYWYPLAYFQSLALQPTALIGLNADLKPPKFSLHCSVRPSVFAYAAPLSAEAAKEVKMVEKAVLSTTARANAKAKSKDAEKVAEGAADMETEDACATKAGDAEEAEAREKEEAVVEVESSSYEVSNPARVVPAQLKYIAFPAETRWEPLRRGAKSGIVLLRDLRPGEPLELVTAVGPGAAAEETAAPAEEVLAQQAAPEAPVVVGGNDEEPPPPEPFEYQPPAPPEPPSARDAGN